MSVLSRVFGRGFVSYSVAVAEAVESIAAAIFLDQIAYWGDKSEDGWVFRTAAQIEEFTALSSKVQRSARNHLIDLEILEEERRQGNRLHYRINHANLEALVQSFPTGKSRPAPGERLDVPKGQTYIEKKEKKEDKNTPEGEGSTSPAANSYTAYLAEELDDADVPLLKGRKDRYAGEFKKLIEKGQTPEVLWKVCDRIVERWVDDNQHYKLTAEQALGDVVSPKKNGQKKEGHYDRMPNFTGGRETRKTSGKVTPIY